MSVLLLGHAAAYAQGAGKSLYERIGGYDVAAAIATDFTKGLGGDPVLRPFFAARSDDSRRRILQMFRELVCADAGGPCNYIGRDMKSAHAGLKIGEAEWEALMKLWNATLDRYKLGEKERAEMVQLFAKYKTDMVSVSATR